MVLISELQAAFNAVKDTASGKIEWNEFSASLKTLESLVITAIQERGVVNVETVEELQALGASETLNAKLIATASTGSYSYRTGAITPDYTTIFPSADSGSFWVQDSVVAP